MNPLATLLPIRSQAIGAETMNAVDARCLHVFLGVGKDFSSWMKDRISQFDFTENQDYCISYIAPQNGGTVTGQRVEYLLTLDMAKELAMVERNEKGKAARLYFIECERQAHDPVHRLLTMGRPEMLELAAGLAREKAALQAQTQAQAVQITALEPKAAFHDRVAASVELQTIQEVAKILGTGPGKFFTWLRQQRIIYGPECLPYQEFLERGYFAVREGTRIDVHGRDRAFSRTYFTGKGVTWIQKRWDEGKGLAAAPIALAAAAQGRVS